MEDQKFDELARKLAMPVTRRQAFKAMVITALGGLLVKSGSGEAFAGGGNSDCAHFCNDVYPPGPGRGECKSDSAHGTGICTVCGPAAGAGHPDVCGVQTQSPFCCPTGQPTCCDNASCVNLQTSVTNCGTCDKKCTGTTPACCSGVCKDLSGDVANCGVCGNVCKGTTPACCGGTCKDLSNDVSNCGACKKTCTAPPNATPTCTGGQCGFVCNPGFMQIGNTCCLNASVCTTGGNAVCGCAGGLVCCPGPGGVCTQLGTVSNCLGCGDTCTAPPNATPICGPNGCTFVCNPGFTNCGGQCVDETSDVNNCGGCGHMCPNLAICQGGVCVCTNTCGPNQVLDSTTCACSCAPGLTNCGGQCVNTSTDTGNCGSCNVHCQSGQVCVGGNCQTVAGTCQNVQNGCVSVPNCNGNSNCYCYNLAEGGSACAVNNPCSSIGQCTSSSQCPAGTVCIVNTCCPTGVCEPICGGGAAVTMMQSVSSLGSGEELRPSP